MKYKPINSDIVNKYIHTISQWFAVQVANTFNTFNATTYA